VLVSERAILETLSICELILILCSILSLMERWCFESWGELNVGI